jgi:hypothetical protein
MKLWLLVHSQQSAPITHKQKGFPYQKLVTEQSIGVRDNYPQKHDQIATTTNLYEKICER